MDGWVELELLCSLRGLEGDDDAGHDFVAGGEVVTLLGLQLGDLALPHLLGLFDLYADRTPEILHQDFGLLHLRGKDL